MYVRYIVKADWYVIPEKKLLNGRVGAWDWQEKDGAFISRRQDFFYSNPALISIILQEAFSFSVVQYVNPVILGIIRG